MSDLSLFDEPTTAVSKQATMSDCGRYRYALSRRWGSGPPVLFVMLNPSTADAEVDDPTIRRCVRFARDWGWNGIQVVNLFALRATDPSALTTADDPVGPDNDRIIREAAARASLTVVAWGAHRMAAARGRQVASMLLDPMCLGATKDGSPRHPLYVPAATLPVLWRPS